MKLGKTGAGNYVPLSYNYSQLRQQAKNNIKRYINEFVRDGYWLSAHIVLTPFLFVLSYIPQLQVEICLLQSSLATSYVNTEILMGHSTGISDSYYLSYGE